MRLSFAVAWPHAPWLVATSLALAFAVGTWVAIASALGHDLVAEVHEGGLVLRRSWRRARVVSFDDITSLHVIRSVSDTSFVLVAGNGARTTVPLGVTEGPRFLAALESEVEKPVLDDAVHALASGEPLAFGPVTLELEGVRHLDDLLPWSDLDRVRVMDGGRPPDSTHSRRAGRSVLVAIRLSYLLPERCLIGTYWRSVGPV